MKSLLHFTQKELAARWGCTVRTVQRDVRRFNLTPADYIGLQPIFNETAVERLERERLRQRLERGGFRPKTDKNLTVKEAKALAGKRGAK